MKVEHLCIKLSLESNYLCFESNYFTQSKKCFSHQFILFESFKSHSPFWKAISGWVTSPDGPSYGSQGPELSCLN